jgi:hypothetical protein
MEFGINAVHRPAKQLYMIKGSPYEETPLLLCLSQTAHVEVEAIELSLPVILSQ